MVNEISPPLSSLLIWILLFSLTGFGIVTNFSNCRKIELWIISFHIYGNDGVGKIAQSNFIRILNLFGTFNNICVEHYFWQNAQTFGEKIPGCFCCGVSLPTSKSETRRENFSLHSYQLTQYIRHVQCTVVWINSHVSLRIFEFYVRVTDPATHFYRMQMY